MSARHAMHMTAEGNVLRLPDGHVGATSDCDYKHEDEDARRLAACWNACVGVETEKLEGKTIAEYVVGEAYLNGMHPAPGGAGFNIGLTGTACQLLANSFAGQFKGSGAVNFLEVGMSHKELGPFIVTIQRVHGQTPAQQKAAALAELAAARALLADIADNEIKHQAAFDAGDENCPPAGFAERIRALLKGGA
jgi:hypothetical protein